MDRNWFFHLLTEEVAAFDDAEVEARLENLRRSHPEFQPRELSRRWVEQRLRQTGMVYGTPLASEQAITSMQRSGYSQRWAVFVATLRIEANLAMEIGCHVSHCTRGNIRVNELLICFALLCRAARLAHRLQGMFSVLKEDGVPPKRLLRLARRIGKRMVRSSYIAGNPLIGLPIHNSFNYINAKTLGRIAVVFFEHGEPDRKAIQRVLDYHDQERRLLLEALLALASSDRVAGRESAQVMIEQIRSLGLSWRMRRTLIGMVKHPMSALAIASAIENDRLRDFLLEQVILGAVLDGSFSERESLFIGDLAGWLGVSPASLAEREAQVVDFYQRHKAFLDTFMVSTAVHSYRQRMLGRLQRSLAENLGVIVGEIKNTGELAELLYRAGTGEKLTKEEWIKVRRQLLEILRSIPSLAIFSLPGGVVLLPLLFKILPKEMKPSAMVAREQKKEEEGSDWNI